MPTSLEYDANAHAVDAVTVFQTNRAEVKRTIKVELTNGQNDVLVKNLPSCLDEDSIRVDGIGNAVIFDVIYHSPEPRKRNDETTNAVQNLEDEKNRLEAEIAILDGQSEVLSSYRMTLSGKDTDTDTLISFLDKFALRQRQIDQSTAQLRKQIDEIEKKIHDISTAETPEQKNIAQRGARVTIIVLAEGDGEAELSLTYVVSNASWKPLYDLRAAIAHDSKSNSTVHLHYRASIAQSTGEDWSNVALTLSTAAPLQGTNVPTLSPHWIDKHEPPPQGIRFSSMKRAAAPLPPPAPVVEAFGMASDAPVGGSGGGLFAVKPPPRFFRGVDSTASDGAVSATFLIPGQSSIPSDSDGNAQTHKVSIAEIDFESVELEWITVPKDITKVFLRCKVQNTSKYLLLPGSTNVFLNNSFVAKSNIPHVSPQESFSCSLGADPSVRVTYHPQSKKVKTTAGFALSAKTTTTVFYQRMSIKNTRLSPVQKLIVKDQIPVSRDSSIKVNLVEPKELSGKTGAEMVPVKKGVRVHWAAQEDSSSSGGGSVGRTDEDLGFVEWICDVGAGEALDLDLAWEVTSPANVQWRRAW